MNTRPLRVLVIDDNRDAADAFTLLLKILGQEACVASDGPAALKVARTFRPEVVLLDLNLGRGMDGCKVARRLRGQVGLLVAVTGSIRQEDRLRCDHAGFDHFLMKPLPLPDLERLLAGTQGATAHRLAV